MRAAPALLLLWALAACGGENAGAPARPEGAGSPRRGPLRVAVDAGGERVLVPVPVRRVVTTVPGQTDTVRALGAGDLLVGIGAADREDAGAPPLPRIPVWPTIPAEAVAALEPDLLLVDATLSSRDLPALRARFPGTFATDSTSLRALENTFERLGDALDRPARGKALADALHSARREARARGSPRVLLLAQGDPPMALGPGALLDDMVSAVGAENVFADLGRPSGEVAPEAVRARAPGWILVTGGGFPDALRERWAGVPAVDEGRVVDLSGDDFVRAGPRTADALRRLAEILSPAGAAR